MSKLRNYLLYIVLFLLPWQTRWIFGQELIAGSAFEYGVLSLYIVEILLFLIVLFSGRPSFAKETKRTVKLTLILLAVVVLAALGSLNALLSWVQVMHIVFAMSLFLILLDERISLKGVITAFVAGLIIPSVLGIVQFATGTSAASSWLGLAARDAEMLGDAVMQSSEGVRSLRAYGSFPHPNVFGGYLSVGLLSLFALWYLLKNEVEKRVLVGVGLILLAAFVFTFSRSAWLGLLLAGIVGALVFKMKNVVWSRRLVIPVAGIVIVVALTMLVFGVGARPGSDAQFESRSTDERVVQYQEFDQVLSGRWFLGSGPGTYTLAMAEVFPDREWWEYQPIHNVPLLIVGEIGVIGLLVVLMWAGSMDRVNFARFPKKGAVVAFMMGNVLLFVMFFDHYLWSSWAGLALVAYVMALTLRLQELK